MRVRLGSMCAFGVVVAATLTVAVRAASDAKDTLRAAVDSDELSLSRVAARVGDDVVLAALAVASDPLAQWAAIRAAPHIIDKEQALLPLATIAASRDPELAALAAWKMARIAQELVREGLYVREIPPQSLAPARAAMLALSADVSARSDIRLYAGQAAHLLGTLGVPDRTS